MNMVYVASRFDFSRRRENLSWSHHETLAALEPDEQEGWLDRAEQHRWSVSDLRLMMRMSRQEEEEEADAEVGEAPVEATDATVLRCPRCGEQVPVTVS
jgi:hypothetical protein